MPDDKVCTVGIEFDKGLLVHHPEINASTPEKNDATC